MKRTTNRFKWTLGIAVIIIAIGVIATTQLSSNVIYFYTPDEAYAKASEISGSTIKVGGMVLPESVMWQPEILNLSFVISDLKDHEIKVSHKGTPPDMFKEGQGVVVEGILSPDGKSITSRRLMVKHSEEYKKPGDHAGTPNKELLQKSIFKD